jgi:hypothetical protein
MPADCDELDVPGRQPEPATIVERLDAARDRLQAAAAPAAAPGGGEQLDIFGALEGRS